MSVAQAEAASGRVGGVDVRRFADIYPFANHWLEVPGGKLHFVDEGPRDAPVILMVHGNPTWSFYYRELIKGLSDRYRVIAPDHLGCGLSDKPQDHSYLLSDRIDHVEALLDHLQISRARLVVHDWGGAIGMGVAVRRPALVERFVVFNTAAFPSPHIPPSIASCRIPGFGAFAVRGLNAFCQAALIRAVHHKDRLSPAVRAGYLEPYSDWGSRVAIHRFVQDIPMKRSHPSWSTLEGIGEGIGQFADRPMMIVWGARDFCFNDHFYEEWVRRFPKAKTHYLEDASHYVVEDAHERILPWVRDFFSEASP